jgi:hypothetical protein
MEKRLHLVFPEENVTAVAELLSREAPRTCEAIWRALPLEGDLIHAMWSGPETYFPIDPAIRAAPEHQTQHPLPGEIGYYSLPGGQIVGWPSDFAEIAFFYGRGSRPSMPTGPVSMNVFARIVENLEGFSRVCARIHLEGVKRLAITKGP